MILLKAEVSNYDCSTAFSSPSLGNENWITWPGHIICCCGTNLKMSHSWLIGREYLLLERAGSVYVETTFCTINSELDFLTLRWYFCLINSCGGVAHRLVMRLDNLAILCCCIDNLGSPWGSRPTARTDYLVEWGRSVLCDESDCVVSTRLCHPLPAAADGVKHKLITSNRTDLKHLVAVFRCGHSNNLRRLLSQKACAFECLHLP